MSKNFSMPMSAPNPASVTTNPPSPTSFSAICTAEAVHSEIQIDQHNTTAAFIHAPAQKAPHIAPIAISAVE